MRTQGSSSTAVARRDGRLHQRSGGTHASALCQAIRADRRGRWRWELRRLSGSMLCIGAGAPNLHLAGDARKYCGDLPSGRRSLFNMETRGKQRARDWAPLTCTCGSGCCAPSDPPHAIATKIAPRLLTVHSG